MEQVLFSQPSIFLQVELYFEVVAPVTDKTDHRGVGATQQAVVSITAKLTGRPLEFLNLDMKSQRPGLAALLKVLMM